MKNLKQTTDLMVQEIYDESNVFFAANAYDTLKSKNNSEVQWDNLM